MVGTTVRLVVEDADPTHPLSASIPTNFMNVSGTINITAQPVLSAGTLKTIPQLITIEWGDSGLDNFDVFYKIGAGGENGVPGCNPIAANECAFNLTDAMFG